MTAAFDFILVDAFTDQIFGGNPCPVVLHADNLSDEKMQALAREMNQSETAFILTSKTCDLKARYFTPEKEIPLAGHPTLAVIHAALESGLIHSPNGLTDISLELNEGPIRVTLTKEFSRTLIKMYQRKPQFLETHDPEVVMPIFGLKPQDARTDAPIQTVSTGTPQLMIAVKELDTLRRIEMNVPAYKEYRDKMKFFSSHLFCLQGLSPEASTFARHPGVPPLTAEDAFTGSSTGGMGAYLWKYGLMTKPSFIAEQGHWMNRPGSALVELHGTPNNIESVSVAGSAVTVAKGQIYL